MAYYTYILRCCDGSLYTGIASDINKRMAQHFGRTARCARYTRSHNAQRLEAVWESTDRSAKIPEMKPQQQYNTLCILYHLYIITHTITNSIYLLITTDSIIHIVFYYIWYIGF